MNLAEQQTETLKELRALLDTQKAETEALGRETRALSLPVDDPPTLAQVEAAASPEILAALRGAAAEAESVLEGLDSPAGPKVKMPRKMRDTI